MLFDLQGLMKPSKPDMLGYSRQFGGGDENRKPAVVACCTAPGQFDDADDDDENNFHHPTYKDKNVVGISPSFRGEEQQQDTHNESFSSSARTDHNNNNTRGLEGSNQGDKVPSSEEARQPSAIAGHPLDWLVEAACDRTQVEFDDTTAAPRTPRRVSLAHEHQQPQNRIDSDGDLVRTANLDDSTPEEQQSTTTTATHCIISMDRSGAFPTTSLPQPHGLVSRDISDSSSASDSSTTLTTSEESGNIMMKDQETSSISGGECGLKQHHHHHHHHHRKTFEEHYQELLAFRKLYGHADVLTRGEYKGLGRWLSTLRCKYRAGGLPEDQAKLLNDVGAIGFDDLVECDRPMIPKSYPVEKPDPPTDKSLNNNGTQDKENTAITWELRKGELPPKSYDNKGLGQQHHHQHHHHHHNHNHGAIPPVHGNFHHHPTRRMHFVPIGSRNQAIPPPAPFFGGPPLRTVPPPPPPPSIPHASAVYPRAPPPPPPPPPQQQPQQQDKDDWNLGINQLNSFLQEYGHANVSTTSVATNKKEHQELSLWLAGQRHLHRKGQLPQERANLLHSYFGCAGFEPSAAPAKPATSSVQPPAATTTIHQGPNAATTFQHYTSAAAAGNPQHYQSEAGTVVAPPAAHPAPYPPSHHRHGRVMPYKKRLHSVEAIHASKVYQQQQHSNPANEQQQQQLQPQPQQQQARPTKKRGQYIGWHDRLEQLMAFRKKNGHADVRIMMHSDCKELGRWLASQRHQYRKGKLPKDKIQILQRMGVNLAYKKPNATGL